MIEDGKKSIAEIEKNMGSYAGDFKKSMQEVIDAQKEQIKEYAKPDNQMIDLMTQGEKMTVDNDLANYQKELTKWEQDFPASHTGFIKRRLQQYIEIANTVDFSAQLKDVGDKKKFVNPAYEAKNNDWKKVFRAGKEVNDVAKPFAAAWIKEL
jgi:Sec-independent protein translocase protein TatA